MRAWILILILLLPPTASAAQESGEEAAAAQRGTAPAVSEAEAVEQQFRSLWPRILYGGGNRHEARVAVENLGSAVVPLLIEKRNAPQWRERWEMVNSLGMIGDPAAAEVVAERVVTDEELHVRWRALWALNALDHPDPASLVRPWFEGDDPELRWNAAVALAFFQQPEATPVLESGLDDPSDWVRWEAVNGLGRVPGPESAAKLMTRIDDPDRRVRQEVVMSLGRIRDETAVQALEGLLDHPDPQIRWRAVQGLVTAAPEGIEAELTKRLESEEDPQVRTHIEKGLDRLDNASRLRERRGRR